MIYCELRSDKDILYDLEDAKSVFLIGCPACANMSLYIQKPTEGSAMMTLTPMGFRAVYVEEEVNRLAHLLADKELDVDSWVVKYPTVALCILDERTRNKISKKGRDFDTVITVCCDAGTKSVGNILTGKRVIPAMKAGGIATAKSMRTMGFAKFYIDRSSVDIMRFTFDT